MYERKVNGKAKAGEFLTGNLDFYTISTTDALSPATRVDPKAPTKAELEAEEIVARRLDKVIEVISLNGQPVIMGAVVKNGSNYILKFAIEHNEAWLDHKGDDALAAALLKHAQITATVDRAADL